MINLSQTKFCWNGKIITTGDSLEDFFECIDGYNFCPFLGLLRRGPLTDRWCSSVVVRPSVRHAHHRRWCINRPSSSPIMIMKLRHRKMSWKSVYFRCFCGLWALWFRLICFRVICWKKICEDLSVTLIIDDDATIGYHRRSIGYHRRSHRNRNHH